MLSKTITFEDLDGNSVTDTFHFNLNKYEVAEMSVSKQNDLTAYLREIIAAEDNLKILQAFKMIVSECVGKRSPDGRRFVKSQEITDEFIQSNAFAELFMEMIQDAGKMSDFINGVVPRGMAEQVQNLELPDGKELTDEDLLAMSDSEFAAVAGRDVQSMSKRHLQIAMRRKLAA